MTSGSTYSATDSSTYALAELAVPEAGPVADQFVGQRARDAGDQEVPDGVLEDRAVTDFLDVAEVGRVPARPRLGERHVADAAGRLAEHLGRHFAVGLPTDAVIGQEAVEFRVVDVCRPMT